MGKRLKLTVYERYVGAYGRHHTKVAGYIEVPSGIRLTVDLGVVPDGNVQEAKRQVEEVLEGMRLQYTPMLLDLGVLKEW